ncbi:hypothetical protein NDU88_010939 [Pleurodeles waltl]|uniref:Uncharacterized protein n=1 Tax=Pleurodeles waltl TaxID=8319 RepID=A0AAV7PZV2_PLEWA|nr:hypothetical protein NDU88_010939 [Pleurodeles waltl]
MTQSAGRVLTEEAVRTPVKYGSPEWTKEQRLRDKRAYLGISLLLFLIPLSRQSPALLTPRCIDVTWAPVASLRTG